MIQKMKVAEFYIMFWDIYVTSMLLQEHLAGRQSYLE